MDDLQVKKAVSPSRSDVHVNRPLTNISIAFLQDRGLFVASRVFPNIPVTKQSDRYFTYDRGHFNRDTMQLRAPGTESAGDDYEIDSTPTYYAPVRALHRDIPDEIRDNADQPLNLDREATEFLSQKALIKREVLWAATHFVTGVWTEERAGVASGPTGTEFLRWDDASSTPIEDVRAGCTTIQESTGYRPNVMVVQRHVYDALLDHPDIVARIDRGQTSGPALANREALAAIFEMDEVLVMGGIQNTAAEGATNVHSFIGGKHCLLAYRPATPSIMTPAAGYTFSWTGHLGAGAEGNRILQFRMQHLKSDRVEIEMAFDQKLVSADLGAFFLDAVS